MHVIPHEPGFNGFNTYRFVKAWLFFVCCPTASSMVPAGYGP